MANPVNHFEILGKDGAKLQTFYRDLFDWKIDANNPMNYGVVQAEEGGIGGGVAQGERPVVTVYVTVADLAASLKKAEAMGGTTVMSPMDVPGGPRIAVFSDPEGNVICLAQAASA